MEAPLKNRTGSVITRPASVSPSGTLAAVLKYAVLLAAVFVILFPPYVVVLNAFKGNEEYAKSGVFDFPHSFANWDNFSTVFHRGDMLNAFMNTGTILVLSVLGNVLMGTMVAFALGRFNFKLKSWILGAYVAATLIPSVTTQVATFGIIKELGLFNSLYGPVLLYIGTDVVQIYLYLQFIRHIPYDLDENAMIEGASLFRIYRSIIFPLLAPATATAVILKSISIYNDMYIPYLYMPSQKLRVVSTGLMNFVGVNSAQWNVVCAALLIILIPTTILYLFMQRFIFSGIVSGSVK
ncbi:MULTISPECIES: carbohydrate ABC transporter permease [unclassified Paenibacillus]|uniref:carbohydrate ABC transporter permease n=1 Tax=unclassified Paenibacillus TaxID=185978 RepID=UPI0010F0987B|nr:MULTISPECIES: carbohydrate ABC transporter permease [unclassified Paenibacillus]NIK69479.1 multiple sugar transport system permease protein [Paenibacillus sp. BK720]TCM95657.1 multiple sugar transport system permease protein [Paenibacillus sp. BK033]